MTDAENNKALKSGEKPPSNFIKTMVANDLESGKHAGRVITRFPPEPNGYLHIGHAKAIGLNFGLGKKYDAPVNLRFDDTNPTKEDQEFVAAIKEDVKWLGYDWTEVTYSSDNFQKLYDWSLLLIKKGKAYVDSQSSEEMALQNA